MSLKQKLINNQLTVGSWITIGHMAVVEIMASAGFEWLVVDMEHTAIDLTIAQTLIATIQAQGLKALVRVAKNEEVIIKKVLDMGADGIIVPMVNSGSDASQAVEFAKYPPVGKRGVGLYRAQQYGRSFEAYKAWGENEMVIIAHIEPIDAVDNIGAILTTDGIDGIIIGPYDLSGSMGYPGEYYRKDVGDAIEKVLYQCKRHNKPSGFHVIESDPETFIQRVRQGCTFLAYSIDFFFLGDMARSGMKNIKESVQ